MSKLCLCLSLLLLANSGQSSPRVRRDECEGVAQEHAQCTAEARNEHMKSLEKDDGEPDFYSRKACNYLAIAVEVCADNLAGECYSEDEVQEIKDQYYRDILEQLEQSEEWDSEKCPSIKNYKDRVAGANSEDTEDGDGEDGEVDEGGDAAEEVEGEDAEDAESQEGENEDEGENGEEGEEVEEKGEDDEEGGEDEGEGNGAASLSITKIVLGFGLVSYILFI